MRISAETGTLTSHLHAGKDKAYISGSGVKTNSDHIRDDDVQADDVSLLLHAPVSTLLASLCVSASICIDPCRLAVAIASQCHVEMRLKKPERVEPLFDWPEHMNHGPGDALNQHEDAQTDGEYDRRRK